MTDVFDMPDGNHSFEERGGWVLKSLVKQFNLSLEQAAGIVGNIGFESGGFKTLQEIRPSVVGSAGGYGWAQWTGPRRRTFEAFCQGRGFKTASDQGNYEFLVEELSGAYGSTIASVRRCATVEDAVFSVGQTYERPGGTTPTHLPGNADRLNYAKRALNGVRTVTNG